MAGMAAENQGWFAYSVLLVVALAMAALPPATRLFVRLFSRSPARTPGAQSGPLPMGLPRVSQCSPVNTRYFSAAQIGAIIGLPLMLVIPLAEPQSEGSAFAAAALLLICALTGCALVHANRKGDLRWIDSVPPAEVDGDAKSGREGVE